MAADPRSATPESRPSGHRPPAGAAPDKSPARISCMFDRIAPRYDLLNHLLSAGLDKRWRNQAIDALNVAAGARVLDLCTGTADLAVAAVSRIRGVQVLGVDFSGEMLRLGLAKVRRGSLDHSIALVRGDASCLPVPDRSCDAVTIGFGIRNVAEPDRALAEIARVLRPGGRLAILEFGEPRIPGIRTLYAWYFRYLLPFIGKMVSKHDSAYSYLPASVSTFPPPAEFSRRIAAMDFSHVHAVPLTFGIVYLYTATRSGSPL